MIYRCTLFRFCLLIVLADVVAFGALAAGRQAPCAQIEAACDGAGFVRGSAAAGNGLEADCVLPILRGAHQPRKATLALPQVDPQVVAACVAAGSSGERRKRARADAAPVREPQSSPPPVATVDSSPHVATSGSKRPNIVFVLTDDLSVNLVPFMPHVQRMQQAGITFDRYVVTDSLCCPSRSSIFTGRFPHNTGIYRNTGDDGGYVAFHNRGHEQATFATALAAAGYRTAMLGKYLNGYLPGKHGVPPGWTSWAVAGNGYPEFNYDLNVDGKLVHHGRDPADYLTDVLSGIAVHFVKESAGKPFFLEVATFAPHAPYTPAPRDASAFAALSAPRTATFDAEPDAQAAQWLKTHRALSAADTARIDADFRKRAQAVLAVDAMIAALQDAVAAIGAQDNTYFVFSSDNGYHMGEHRLMPGKMTAYEEDIRVPLVVTGPGVPAGAHVDAIAENIDLCPTFTELAGMTSASTIDGRSLVPVLHGDKPADSRSVALVEHRGPVRESTDPDLPAPRSGNPPTYEALRGAAWLYVEYVNGDREYHDLERDPSELANTFASLPPERKAVLHTMLDAMQNCRGRADCAAAERFDARSAAPASAR